MKNICENCGKCCLETEMILSHQDINSIINSIPKKISKDYFVFKNSEGHFQLKNFDGHCIFFNFTLKTCNIYEFRPQGCIFYPFIYDFIKKKCVFDNDCPRTHLFYQNEKDLKKICKNLKIFLTKQLKIETG
ncbi:MAG: YkgJ family cysteine cluster protein [Promethearchaeota archaeon]|nr:MAG: YkgJ family cysteine cluster protein [Candidatus Lokiarchaeota archaeon]